MAAKGASLIDSRDGRANPAVMFSRLTRIMLALVTAFVFTGQMEAAAQHCARLAQAAHAAAIVVAPEPDAPPCHEATAAAAGMHAVMSQAHGPAEHSGHANAPPHCECIAALTGWIDLYGATTSARVEAYAWLAPSETNFASATPDPDLRPPRA